MKTINYKGKGEHSVRELELIIEQQAEELHLLKSGQEQLRIADVMLSLPTTEEIEAWAKEQAKIEPTGAEEFGRKWGAIWMRGLIEQKLKGNGA